MSKNIYLYSEDKKYKCAVELAESLDRLGYPDHSMIILFEERDNGTYVIAQTSDKLLETEKDQQIAELKKQLEVTEQLRQEALNEGLKVVERDSNKIKELQEQLKYRDSRIQELLEQVRLREVETLEINNKLLNAQFQLKSQPKEIVEKIKEFVDSNALYYEEEQYAKHIDKYLDEILKEYGE